MRKGSKMNRTVKATVGLVAIAAMSLTGLAACGGSSADDGKGKVYFLNFKPETADQWVALAKKYTDKTGVQVKVQTAASGTYQQTLKSELAKSDARRSSRSTDRSATRTGRATLPTSRTPASTTSSITRTSR